MWYLDNINVVKSEDSKKAATKYEEYFSVMNLDVRALKRRIAMAKELEEAFFLLFLAWFYESDEEEAEDKFRNDYLDIVEKYDDVGLEDEFVEYIVLLAALLRDSTKRGMEEADTKDPSKMDEYYASFDRATFVAANEANTALNKIEYAEAKRDGKKTKTWHTERDLRVRPTHVPLDGKTIPIDEYFDVGKSKMLYPKQVGIDIDANEVVNCRCSISYS